MKCWLLWKLARAYWEAWWLVRQAKRKLRKNPNPKMAEGMIALEASLAACRQLFKVAIKKELGL